mmetsp:Transcript_12826/g.31120  ORF Transcript_12826/g.31120 Transcript_12826/m.31120 type:complete len:434 (+) Transcript_12826:210-1511(+)
MNGKNDGGGIDEADFYDTSSGTIDREMPEIEMNGRVAVGRKAATTSPDDDDDDATSDQSIRIRQRCQGKRNRTSRKRPRQQQQDNAECIIEVNPPPPSQREKTTRTFVATSLVDGDSVGSPLEASAEEQQQWYEKSEAGSSVRASISIQSNRDDGEQTTQSIISQLPQQQQQQQPRQVYRGENLCPFCGYKCPDEEFPDGAVNHLRRFHSHQYHFTIEVLEPQTQASLPTLLPTLCTTKMLATESDASSLSSANVPSNTMPRGNRSTIVVTAEPVMLRERLGIDRRSDLRCQRTYYYIKSKIPIQTGHHQRDEQDEATNEWNQQLREKMICDIEDAGKGEQKFMSLWNKYWMSRPGKGERIVMTPAKVQAFIDQYASHLAPLEWELMAHLIALWEHKLLSSQHIEDCMIYHQQVQQSQLKSSQKDGNENYQQK